MLIAPAIRDLHQAQPVARGYQPHGFGIDRNGTRGEHASGKLAAVATIVAAFAKSLGISEPTVEGLRADVKKNLEREVKFRVLARNKSAVMDALVSVSTLDLPKALVTGEVERMTGLPIAAVEVHIDDVRASA